METSATVPLRTPARFFAESTIKSALVWVSLIIAHSALAMVMHGNKTIATLHAFGTFAGVLIVVFGRFNAKTTFVAAFYVLGSEILWRMCGAAIPWETGKYAVVLLCGLSALRSLKTRPFWPLLYFLLLIPSSLGILFDYSPDVAKRLLSFNLSGPLALAICLWWSVNRNLLLTDFACILRTALVPLSGVLTITLFSTYSQQLVFTTEANFASSGGFGPNQVSALLGLGAALCFGLLAFGKENILLIRLVLFGLMGLFLMQSMMTFSRTGVYLAAGFMLSSGLVLLRTRRARIYLVLGAIIVGSVGGYLVFPRLDAYTGGMLAARYAETHTTGRSEIMEEEIEIFLNNPILGIGPGGAKAARRDFTGFASHSEPTRLLAEHGVFGFLALGLLMWQVVKALLRPRPLVAKACVTGAAIWTAGFMLASGMRLVAPALILALVFVHWSETPERSISGNAVFSK